MRIASIPGPTASIVSLADLKAHLRVDGDDEDARIMGLGLTGTAYVEKWTQRALSPRDATLRLSSVPAGATPLALPGGVVNSLASLTVDGVAVLGLSVVGDSPARVVPSADWPLPTGDGFPVVVTYSVGYQVAPQPLVDAVKLYVQWLFDGTDTQAAAEHLMRPYRIRPL